ncbi:MAG TPA: LCP family protein [Actinocrinis sp.]|nr:LCP family protein [Actinocrinis sp.]
MGGQRRRGRGQRPGQGREQGQGQWQGQEPGQEPGLRRSNGGPVKRKRKPLKWIGLSLAVVVFAAGGTAAYVYVHFNQNLKSAPLLPKGVTQSPEVSNQFGQTAMNILLLGNAGRINAADCHLGGACIDTAPTADTMMVIHLAADRSNMTVMSIPRDSIVNLPACAQDPVDLINASLAHGPSCSVEAVHDLTGLTIDHFIEIDMAGIVTMSNALGGVPVCVTNNIEDRYSHLKLPKGRTVIQGTQALAWLRTRHAFINEVYREQAQHLFMAALLRKLKDNASLTHVMTLYSVADSATKALTVDSQLSSVTDLLSLAQEIGKVPTSRVTMLSVPTVDYSGPNTSWRLSQLQFQQPEADQMFAAIKADTAYTRATTSGGSPTAAPGATGSSAPSSSAASNGSQSSATSLANKAAVRVLISNGSGIRGRAATIRAALVSDGFSGTLLTTGNADPTGTTALYYPANRADSAAVAAAALGIPSAAMHESASAKQVTVVIGSDWTSGTTFRAGAASSGGDSGSSGGSGSGSGAQSAATVASSPPDNSLMTNGADAKACVYVPHPEW